MRSILFINSFAEPNPVGSNNTPVAVALALQNAGYSVEMLTLSSDPTWKGPRPDESSPLLEGVPYIRVVRDHISYIVIAPPNIWSDRYPLEKEWNASVSWASKALNILQPSIVHQWVWQQLSYFMMASTQLKIPTVYSAQDYGLACQRVFLLTGKNKLCDEVISWQKCSQCVLDGRNLMGRLNEAAANIPPVPHLLNILYGVDGQGFFAKLNGVRSPVKKRTGLAMDRCRSIVTKLNALQVSSETGRNIFLQYGIKKENIFEIPWFHDHTNLCTQLPVSPPFVIAYVGRIAPNKGIETLMESLRHVKSVNPVILKIAGEIDSKYGIALKAKYGSKILNHSIEWVGWITGENMSQFYSGINVAVVPSTSPETGPRTLIEALAHGRPIICTNLPAMNTLIKDNINGLLFSVADQHELASKIQMLINSPELVLHLAKNTKNVLSVDKFSNKIKDIYSQILI